MKISNKYGRAVFAGCALILMIASTAFAQDGDGGREGHLQVHQKMQGFEGASDMGFAPGPFHPGGPEAGPHGPAWWKNPRLVQTLALSADQQKKLNDLFLQSQMKVIDLRATTEKEELSLHSLLDSDQPDESKILSQIDKVTQAHAELEKEHIHTMLAMRHVLTPEQWNKLHAEDREDHGPQHGPGRVSSDRDNEDREPGAPPR